MIYLRPQCDNNITVKIKSYLTLCRVNLSLFAACSAATGFFAGPYHHLTDVLPPALAVFLLASGASALNQYQERDIDASMERTRRRPLPSGTISPSNALLFSIGLILTGMLILVPKGLQTIGMGIFAVFWYNGIYTYLKQRTAFASIPGAAVGMIPPALGWVSAAGALLDARIGAICFILFMWQIPHFWLLLLRHADEYKKADVPSLIKIMSPAQISRVTFTWIFAAGVSSLLLPLYGSINSWPVYCLLILLAAWLAWKGSLLVKKQPPPLLYSGLFWKINIFLLSIMSILSLENIFLRS
jgi:protoheme IX farnesyltransferase